MYCSFTFVYPVPKFGGLLKLYKYKFGAGNGVPPWGFVILTLPSVPFVPQPANSETPADAVNADAGPEIVIDLVTRHSTPPGP